MPEVAVLRCEATGRRLSLGARSLVGRSPLAQVPIVDPTISAEHASIYYDGSCWKVRDLASRNGTFVDERPCEPQRSVVLEAEARIRFGPSPSNTWVVVCCAPPGPSALAAEGDRVVASGHALWLPNADQPEACVRHDDAAWFFDTASGPRTVVDGEELTVGGRRFTLELPPGQPALALSSVGSTFDARPSDTIRLEFTVSQDEEHVSLEVRFGSRTINLGARAHNYALLVLARQRQQETSQGIAPAEAGWLYSRDLFARLQTTREALNLLLWRAIQCFKSAGLPGEQLIERRLDAGQVRIGIEELSIAQSGLHTR